MVYIFLFLLEEEKEEEEEFALVIVKVKEIKYMLDAWKILQFASFFVCSVKSVGQKQKSKINSFSF